jgi:ABC-2 type transport system permease protein
MGPAPDGSALAASPMHGMTNTELALALLATTVVLTVVAQVVYRWCVRRAWRNGKIEEQTGV